MMLTLICQPNRLDLEAMLAMLELPDDIDESLKGPYTAQKRPPALAFASGCATTVTIIQQLVDRGHIISISDVYGGTCKQH